MSGLILVQIVWKSQVAAHIVCKISWLAGKIRGHSGPQIRVCSRKLFFLFLIQNICFGYSKEPSHRDSSFGHPKHMFKLMGKKIITILRSKNLLNWPNDVSCNSFEMSSLICFAKEWTEVEVYCKFKVALAETFLVFIILTEITVHPL